jgi:RNA-directed DNA polymerase
MNLWNETKSVPISREQIWSAYKKVKANKGSAGVDSVSMEAFDADRSANLYKLWNRMASGSYFPPPVKEVEIPKKDGKVRKLGIPTIADRVGQMAVKRILRAKVREDIQFTFLRLPPRQECPSGVSNGSGKLLEV